ncbi:class I SAM-dependent methyltransferase [Aeromicrobium sp. CF4.19]|uniref:class I SAM-dependent methyltransferase n=1 Tax=Aeromicrobium sp. CF4.19 TaxID=3373082 RepID=UPI003EE68073
MAAGSTTRRVFDVLARPYDLPVVQRIGYERNHDAVMSVLRVAGARRVLDVGCGTGILTARIARELRPESLVGIDPSEGMLQRARERAPSVDFRVGGAESLPVEPATFDAVTSTEAFHFFDQPAALGEFHHVLAPGGLAIVVSVRSPAAGVIRTATSGAVSMPTSREVADLFTDAGLDVVEQRLIPRVVPGFFTSVATIARRP